MIPETTHSLTVSSNISQALGGRIQRKNVVIVQRPKQLPGTPFSLQHVWLKVRSSTLFEFNGMTKYNKNQIDRSLDDKCHLSNLISQIYLTYLEEAFP